MPQNRAEIKAQPRDVVFITTGATTVWPKTNPANLEDFLADCEILGMAIWRTPSVIYVFTGEIDG